MKHFPSTTQRIYLMAQTRGGSCSLSHCSIISTGSREPRSGDLRRTLSVWYDRYRVRDDRHVRSDLPEPMGKGENTWQRIHRHRRIRYMPYIIFGCRFLWRSRLWYWLWRLRFSENHWNAPCGWEGEKSAWLFTEQVITIAMCAAGTMATRFIPLLVFREK